MTIIDTHAHIDQLDDLPGALDRAYQAGVSDIVAVSIDLDSMQKLMAINKEQGQLKIHMALGVHPGQVLLETQSQALDFMRAHIKQARAIGETGLDYWYKGARKDQEERQKQKESFAMHLGMARECDLPIIIHSRGAWRDCLSMARAAAVRRVLFHWYSGPADILEGIIDAGFYVSCGPSVAYSPESRKAMTSAPLERILIETDTPVRYKDGDSFFTAEPRDVTRTWRAPAQLKNLNETEALEAVNSNAKEFFGI